MKTLAKTSADQTPVGIPSLLKTQNIIENNIIKYMHAAFKIPMTTFFRVDIVFKSLFFFSTIASAFPLDGFFLDFFRLTKNPTNQIQDIIAINHNPNTSKVVAIKSISVEKLFPGTFFIASIEKMVSIIDIKMTIAA
ncbi:MAG: hypothetical protein K6G49_01655 [Candidatus Saccharibacteria bacterium]|nr:hypothetical protein [Candidatus Saccharibacteria bacterium]